MSHALPGVHGVSGQQSMSEQSPDPEHQKHRRFERAKGNNRLALLWQIVWAVWRLGIPESAVG